MGPQRGIGGLEVGAGRPVDRLTVHCQGDEHRSPVARVRAPVDMTTTFQGAYRVEHRRERDPSFVGQVLSLIHI